MKSLPGGAPFGWRCKQTGHRNNVEWRVWSRVSKPLTITSRNWLRKERKAVPKNGPCFWCPLHAKPWRTRAREQLLEGKAGNHERRRTHEFTWRQSTERPDGQCMEHAPLQTWQMRVIFANWDPGNSWIGLYVMSFGEGMSMVSGWNKGTYSWIFECWKDLLISIYKTEALVSQLKAACLILPCS